jgi:hypothetical protein
MELRWNSRTDKYDMYDVEADDTIHTNVVVVPRLNIAGVRDNTKDNLTAGGAMARLRTIIDTHTENEFEYARTATEEDVEKAVSKLNILEFRFDVRPFNPHPRVPGEKLDDLLKAAHAGRFRGVAEPSVAPMTNADGGIVSEAMGLAKERYGQYSV